MIKELDDILFHSLRIFKKYGIKRITMDDLSREMGISKKTLYRFIENKVDLLEKVIDYENKKIDELFNRYEETGENSIDVLFNLSFDVIRMLKEINPVFTYDLQKIYPELCREHFEQKRKKTFENIKKNLLKGIEEGVYRKDIDVEMVALLYVQNMENVMNPDFLYGPSFSASGLFKVMFENHIRSIANEKGMKYFEEKIKDLNFNI
ncbi:MAG TPA: TetR/AcrR family transcriptional regulator [Bacteroidia bacterium]|nr:TetR/AcrR family transcriptional regulator [Bacteroidia bacterium]HRS59369.1 TetR/AcrR family transcriptional regulator [Bacteroidia bacterium]HRU68827.1 TetR/AcrR family transcriptional regulator [Bacteroidia bacterium]